MSYSSGYHAEQRIYAQLGYKMSDIIPVEELVLGDKIIVLTPKGEPVMSGSIDEITDGRVRISDMCYNSTEYVFRRM